MKPFTQFFLENSPETLDRQYFDAIKKGDEDTIKRMVLSQASLNGYDTLAWHGTPVGEFDKFKLSKSFGSLYFFAKSEEYAKYYANRFQGSPNPKVMELLLKIENPLKVDTFEPDGVKTAYMLRKKGYDSVETPNAYIVFLPDQIKSAKPITYTKKGNVIPLSKRFNMDSELISEYRHNLGDGTPTPSIQAHNGKDPNRLDKKNLHTIGDYKKMNPKMNIPGSILTPQELGDMGITYEHGKIFQNVKNSGFGIEMTSINGKPMGRVFKSSVK